jgi:hypothetical protein
LAVFQQAKGGIAWVATKITAEVIEFAKKAVKEHLAHHIVEHIFDEIERSEDLTNEYLDLIEERNGGKFPAKSKVVEELREEIAAAVQYLFVTNKVAHNWPVSLPDVWNMD